MSDEAKLGMVAGVLAVIGVAVFGLPRDGSTAKLKPAVAVTAKEQVPQNTTPAYVGIPSVPTATPASMTK